MAMDRSRDTNPAFWRASPNPISCFFPLQYAIKKSSQYLTDYVNAYYQSGAMDALLARGRLAMSSSKPAAGMWLSRL